MLNDTSLENVPHQPTVRSVALECLTEANGDWQKAAALMRCRIDEDEALHRMLLEPMIDAAIWQQIRAVSNEQRIKYTRPPNPDDSSGIARVANTTAMSWLDYPLSSGQKLGTADKDKLIAEAEMHRGFAKGNEQKAKLFELIARRIDGKRVSQVLDSAQIEKIWKKVTC